MKKALKEKLGGITKTNKLCNLFLAILCRSQDFLQKLPKLVVIRNACIVYLVNFGTQFSTLLKYLFSQIKQPCLSMFLCSIFLLSLLSDMGSNHQNSCNTTFKFLFLLKSRAYLHEFLNSFLLCMNLCLSLCILLNEMVKLRKYVRLC